MGALGCSSIRGTFGHWRVWAKRWSSPGVQRAAVLELIDDDTLAGKVVVLTGGETPRFL